MLNIREGNLEGDKNKLDNAVVVDSSESQETPLFLRDMKALIEQTPISSDDVGERCFSLLGGRVVFGLLFAELSDSFLVGLASTLVSDGHEIDGKLLTASPVIRLLKSGVAFVSIPELEHQYYYFRHIRRLTGTLPGYFTPVRLQKIGEAISMWKEREKTGRLLSSSEPEQESMIHSLYESTTRH